MYKTLPRPFTRSSPAQQKRSQFAPRPFAASEQASSDGFPLQEEKQNDPGGSTSKPLVSENGQQGNAMRHWSFSAISSLGTQSTIQMVNGKTKSGKEKKEPPISIKARAEAARKLREGPTPLEIADNTNSNLAKSSAEFKAANPVEPRHQKFEVQLNKASNYNGVKLSKLDDTVKAVVNAGHQPTAEGHSTDPETGKPADDGVGVREYAPHTKQSKIRLTSRRDNSAAKWYYCDDHGVGNTYSYQPIDLLS